MPVIISCPHPESTELIRHGLSHACKLLEDLRRKNNEYLDGPIDVATFICWLREDNPEFAVEIDASSLTDHFARRLGRLLCLAERLEKIATHLYESGTHESSTAAYTKLDNSAVRETLRHAFPCWSKEVIADAVDDAAIILFRDETRALAGCNRVTSAPLVHRHRVQELTSMLEHIRERAKSKLDTCYLISRDDVPQSLREFVLEKSAVVVPLSANLDASFIFHSKNNGVLFRELVIEEDGTPPLIPVMGLDDGRALFDFEALRESVFRRFRAQLPILYVSKIETVLVTYPFQQFIFENTYYSAVTGLQIEWENETVPFEVRVDQLRRTNLPRHVYVSRFVEDLSRSRPITGVVRPLRHWARSGDYAVEQLAR
ncbi:hypothetical protein SAMN04487926_14538 [Paraburkholderia steynii]|uniref:Uncharacterized protein n=1 Tax=Paraburkholderia steynii TaxID=1245441 RepID=A0A7Z7BJ62_9BURK|nr:hypothetical protein [Paraburkholderia steynii]SDJ36614.1 hypothetical protein SAMN04487926_14538 [Paraburkholderia steynii]